MTEEEYTAILKRHYQQVDWTSRESIRLYNDFARELRNLYLKQKEGAWK